MTEEKRIFPSREKKPNQQSLFLFYVGAGLILVAIAAFLAIPKALAQVQSDSSSAQPVAVDYPAPAVLVTDLNNTPVSLADFKGQVVLYNAWATWCPPCKEEMPTLDAFYQAHKQDGFVVVAIEDGEPVADVAKYVANNGLTFPVWTDVEYVATTAFKTDVLPSSFVINRQGQVVLSWNGPISRAALEKYVTPLIKQ